ncbi:MAG: TonB-dependent receptor plug domain-containing protein [Cellvibrionaceae bacterium]
MNDSYSNNPLNHDKRHYLSKAIASAIFCSSVLYSNVLIAQENTIAPPEPEKLNLEIEEIVVTSRLKDSASQIIIERIEQPYSAEVLGVDQIIRAGDSNVASALQRVTGLTLVDGKYIYVRGLGERYSSTTLNGAFIPSPELTRNVIPLDLFPSSILDSVKIYKSYSADQPASFGGGNINIRTRGVPDGPLLNISIGTGWDSNSSDDGLKTLGDGGGLPGPIANAINVYQGDLSRNSIVQAINTDGGIASSAERAQADLIHRELLTSLNRQIDIKEESLSPDISGSIGLGNSWYITDDLEFGVLANYENKTQTRNKDYVEREYSNPLTNYTETRRTVEEENITAALNLGLNYQEKHFLTTNSYKLENNEDQSRISTGFDSNFEATDGRQKIGYETRLEERELTVNQIIGEHIFEHKDFGFFWVPKPFESFNVRWIYSDANASTTVPNGTDVEGVNSIDPISQRVLSTSLLGTTSMAQFSFLELEDDVLSYGMDFEAPFSTENFFGTVSGGWLDSEKTREYYGYTANINASGISSTVLAGTPAQVLTNANLNNLNNNFGLTMGADFGTESYIAAQNIEGVYGAFDATWKDTWRISAGVRWEQFQQAVLPVDLLDFTGVTVQQLIDDLQDPNQRLAIQEDDYFPSIAMTFMGTDFLGAETFQLRASLGQTVIRPDLREVSDVQYIDPELNIRVSGNPNLVSAELDHLDLRAELFFSEGSNLTASIFYKDITNPIETIEGLAGDRKKLEFVNSESGEIYGIEIEGLKEIGYGLFLSGNMTMSDSETTFTGINSQTNNTRRLTGHSKYVINAQLGYDSDNGVHSVSTLYNYFSERLFFGGINPAPDAFEQPIHSLDVVYSYYPIEHFSLKLKLKNLLGEDLKVEQGSTTIIEQERGTSIGLDLKYSF